MAFHDLIGISGVVLILGAYLLLQLDRLSQQHLAYSALNGIGAVLILYSLYFDFNLASVIIEFAWLAISILGIYRSIRRAPTDSSR